MKLFLVLFLISFTFLAQTKRVELQIKTDDKITVHGFSYWQQINIKSADTSFSLSLHKKNPDVISNLKAGNYTVSATSIFNDQVRKKVSLQKKSTFIKLTGLSKMYHKVAENINLTEKIKLNDTLYIIYNTSRNDENNNVKLGIIKNQEGFTAILYEGLTNTVYSRMQCPKDLYKYVAEFEASVKKANSPKAETTDNKEIYTIEINTAITTVVIPGTWQGLDKLRAVLFAIQKQ